MFFLTSRNKADEKAKGTARLTPSLLKSIQASPSASLGSPDFPEVMLKYLLIYLGT